MATRNGMGSYDAPTRSPNKMTFFVRVSHEVTHASGEEPVVHIDYSLGLQKNSFRAGYRALETTTTPIHTLQKAKKDRRTSSLARLS